MSLPYRVEDPERIPKQRYYDPDFFRMEAEFLWPRVWQMACRLEEIPRPGDFAEYGILDQSVVIVRTDDMGVTAFHNTCRHRGVRLLDGRGSCGDGIVCPFHGWCYAADGRNTAVTQPRAFSDRNLEKLELDLSPVRCEAWGGCVWINLDDTAPPLRDCIEPFASVFDAWKVESLRAEWWYACRLPANWKLAEEAFLEQYHVLETHPQLRIPDRYPRDQESFDPRAFVEAELKYLRSMSEGMNGMVHARDVQLAESLRDIELPVDFRLARKAWDKAMNAAVTRGHRERGCDVPDINQLDEEGFNEPLGYCFPHYFLLPMYSSAVAYRFRPLGPEETLMDIWSLTRYPSGEEPEAPPVPEPWQHDDPRWPPIPAQDFSNIPRQQLGLHARTFEYMRLSGRNEGHISNYQRVIDGYLAGLPYSRLTEAVRKINVNPLEMPIVDLGI